MRLQSLPGALTRYFGAQDVPELREHELDRSRQRIVGLLVVSALWLANHLAAGPGKQLSWISIAVTIAYFLGSVAYRHLLTTRAPKQVFFLYLFLVLDPLYVNAVLVEAPEVFAFLNPFLLVVIVRSGIRYGVRTMYLSWALTLIGSVALLTRDFWRSNVELTLTLMLMLALVPAFFAHLIRHIHHMRVVEEERARLASMQGVVEARDRFLAKISHEIRSPLQGLLSALDLFDIRHRGRGHSHDDLELISRLRRLSLLLSNQLRDLLTLAKGEAGRLEIRPEVFEAGALVDGIADSARDYAKSKGLELVVDLPHKPAFVVADGPRIDQILTNLVLNSIRYTEKGQVRIAMRPYSPERTLLRFDVADTGPGLSERALSSLLDPLAKSSTMENIGGSGLGMAVVRTLVDHLGGNVSAKSTPGRGTTFTVEVPVESAGEVVATPSSRAQTGRILVVDDRDDVLNSVAEVVDTIGFECDKAISVPIAINLLAMRRYDTILFDIEMPGRSGAELAAQTRRRRGPNQTARLIGMSACEIGDGLRSAFDTCLAKPIDLAALRACLLVAAPTARRSQPDLWTDEAAR